MKKILTLMCMLSLCTMTIRANADVVTLGSSNDTWIRDGFSHAANGTGGTLDWRLSFVPYIQFDMSGLGIDNISDATLNVTKIGSARNDGINGGRFATYGLINNPGNTLQNWDELIDFDPTDTTNGLDFRNVGAEHTLNTGDGLNRGLAFSLDAEDGASTTESFAAATGATNGETSIALTGADLVAFLNTRADDSGLVTFMFPFEQSGRGAGIASKEHATVEWQPTLELTFVTSVPEPGAFSVLCLGAVGALVRRRRAA